MSSKKSLYPDGRSPIALMVGQLCLEVPLD